jgi:fatty-acyl-CoA synthase
MVSGKPLKSEDQGHYHRFDRDSIQFLRTRYNRITRWVIADIVRRSAYRYPDKPALVFGDTVLTYAQLEEATNRVAQGLLSLGLKRFDRVAILAHNTLHHVLT